jgi:hypothetical protein
VILEAAAAAAAAPAAGQTIGVAWEDVLCCMFQDGGSGVERCSAREPLQLMLLLLASKCTSNAAAESASLLPCCCCCCCCSLLQSGAIGQLKQLAVQVLIPAWAFSKDDIRFQARLAGDSKSTAFHV